MARASFGSPRKRAADVAIGVTAASTRPFCSRGTLANSPGIAGLHVETTAAR
jgi:hypothetical protein